MGSVRQRGGNRARLRLAAAAVLSMAIGASARVSTQDGGAAAAGGAATFGGAQHLL
jgi:hypothetical protein